ncbi:MAG: hypothetical protein SynsKO_45310 [Synoicihabitans sp.]
MKIETDEDKYMEQSKSFLTWLEKWIENAVSSSSKLKEEEKEELIENLMWNVSSLLDGTGNLEHEGKALVPYLGFQLEQEEAVIFDEGNIALHELLDGGEDEWED